MEHKILIFFILTLIGLVVGIIIAIIDRMRILEFERRLEEKENNAYNLYDDLENLMEQMQNIYYQILEQYNQLNVEHNSNGKISAREKLDVVYNENPCFDQKTETFSTPEEKDNAKDNKEISATRQDYAIDLIEKGWNLKDIAKEMDMNMAEVRFIAELSKFKGKK
ncbi:hypothetical protein [Xylanivirga thermophila]|jgi:hydroxymethylpyrimidine pyrophosphatase-like HAD family hydrolase|uniref:hypothetical protein n=1 Tax=Xylanivirga thermophila TaxID=2496273 RepID=UPI00101CDF28|nr:hypothetical protein [Xylanivirga thermophila]